MKVEELARAVREMRDAQKHFYSLPKESPEKQPALRESKGLEGKVDRMLDDVLGSSLAALFH
jgi:hypothetical protein